MSSFRKLIYSFLITLFVTLPFCYLTSHLNIPALTAARFAARRVRRGRPLPMFHPAVLSGQNKKTLPSQTKTVDVVARVGGYSISTLSGWASPFAEVSLSSQGIARKTLADKTSFFVFNSVPLPDNPEELCLISQDVNQLPSFPLCLAPPPRNQNIEIQDVLLSPTLSLENGKVATGKTTKASGMTVPNSKVEVYLFTERNFSLWTKIIKSAFAANFPIYETKSNENGYFEFSLPASTPSNNRIFVSAIFNPLGDIKGGLEESNHSPKSNTLAFQVMGLWELFKRFLQELFNQARSLLPNWNDPLFIIMIEILILFGLLAAVLAKKGEEKTKEVKGH